MARLGFASGVILGRWLCGVDLVRWLCGVDFVQWLWAVDHQFGPVSRHLQPL